MITFDELKSAQEFNFPVSTFLTDEEVRKWLGSGYNTHLRLQLIELTYRYPVKLFILNPLSKLFYYI